MSVGNAILAVLATIGGIASIIQIRLWIQNWQNSRVDSFSAVERRGLDLLRQIKTDGFEPDFVLGLGRSGAFLGGWLAGNLGSVPIEVIDRIHKANATDPMEFPYCAEKIGLIRCIYGEDASVLVVEGATTRGTTFYQFEKIREQQAPYWKCRYCVLYEVDTSTFHTQFVGQRMNKAPIRYPWHKTPEYKDFIRLSKGLSVL